MNWRIITKLHTNIYRILTKWINYVLMSISPKFPNIPLTTSLYTKENICTLVIKLKYDYTNQRWSQDFIVEKIIINLCIKSKLILPVNKKKLIGRRWYWWINSNFIFKIFVAILWFCFIHIIPLVINIQRFRLLMRHIKYKYFLLPFILE